MSLLVAARAKRPVSWDTRGDLLTSYLISQDMGYTPDFVQCLGPLLGQVKEQGLKVVANAGGINPAACVQALRTASEQAGVELSIAMVTGDDLLPKVSTCYCMCVV